MREHSSLLTAFEKNRMIMISCTRITAANTMEYYSIQLTLVNNAVYYSKRRNAL